MRALPNELIKCILINVDHDDMLEMRACCRAWSHLIAPKIFDRVDLHSATSNDQGHLCFRQLLMWQTWSLSLTSRSKHLYPLVHSMSCCCDTYSALDLAEMMKSCPSITRLRVKRALWHDTMCTDAERQWWSSPKTRCEWFRDIPDSDWFKCLWHDDQRLVWRLADAWKCLTHLTLHASILTPKLVPLLLECLPKSLVGLYMEWSLDDLRGVKVNSGFPMVFVPTLQLRCPELSSLAYRVASGQAMELLFGFSLATHSPYNHLCSPCMNPWLSLTSLSIELVHPADHSYHGQELTTMIAYICFLTPQLQHLRIHGVFPSDRNSYRFTRDLEPSLLDTSCTYWQSLTSVVLEHASALVILDAIHFYSDRRHFDTFLDSNASSSAHLSSQSRITSLSIKTLRHHLFSKFLFKILSMFPRLLTLKICDPKSHVRFRDDIEDMRFVPRPQNHPLRKLET